MKKNRLQFTQEMDAAKAAAKTIMTSAEKEDRDITPEERTKIQGHLDNAKDLKAKIDGIDSDAALMSQIDSLTVSAGATPMVGVQPQVRHLNGQVKSLGQQFVEAEGMMAFFKDGKHRKSSAWHSPSAELMATTIDNSSGSGGDLVIPNYLPGILPGLTRRLVVADLLSSGSTDSPLIAYLVELVFTNAAAAVGQGGVKPESAITYDLVNETVKKIAHWLPVTDEMLSDVSQLKSYIDARLKLGVELTEEDQLLNGSGTGNNILGLMNRSGLATAISRNSGASETNEDAIFRQIWAIFTNSFLMPDGIVMNPTNWQTIALRKDTTGQYIGSNPFAATMTAQRLWGLPVAVTPAQTANTSLVGAYKMAAQVFRMGGIVVEASNSHADFFIKNLTAIRAEERAGLAVYRPASIGKVDTLN
jgi:HK97 family phage major capsid protein